MPDLATNLLYYGDNLDILRRYLPDGAVDLVYLDPPFNPNRDDKVIFRDESGNATDAQLLAPAERRCPRIPTGSSQPAI
jgi:site-specific DNA-methyltransferase (adenine-specific)